MDQQPSTRADRPEDERPGAGEPEVTATLVGDTAVLTVVGELTETARRPLVRALTDLLLSHAVLHRVDLRLGRVSFMNSGGMAVLVQLQKLGQPRGVDVVLVGPGEAVTRPLQLAGLWHRFRVVEEGGS